MVWWTRFLDYETACLFSVYAISFFAPEFLIRRMWRNSALTEFMRIHLYPVVGLISDALTGNKETKSLCY